MSANDPVYSPAGNTGSTALVTLEVPSTYPTAGESFAIEAFGVQQQANATNAITVDIINQAGTVLATASVQAGGTTQAAPGRGWHFRGLVHVRSYDVNTRVANLAAGANLSISGLPPGIGSGLVDSSAITQLSLRIRSSQGNAAQSISCFAATITEVRPFFTGTIG